MNIDAQLLLYINGHHNEVMDQVMWYISQSWFWIPLYIAIIYFLFRQLGWKQALMWVLLLAAAAGLADFISSGIIKNWVCRPRPTHEPTLEGMVHLVRDYRGGHYGFVSSHAANTCALATLFCLKVRNQVWYWIMGLFVVLNCYSRMYLGVHYPGDILGGLTIGLLVAWLIYWVAQENPVQKARKKSAKSGKSSSAQKPRPPHKRSAANRC